MNNLTIIGRLTADPDFKFTVNNTPIATFSIAWEDIYLKKKNDPNATSFFDCVMFGKSAESFSQYNKKGDAVILTGSIAQERWTQDDGTKRSKVKLRIFGWEFPPQNKRRDDPKPAPQKVIDYTGAGGHEAVEDDDIPFGPRAHDNSLGEC